MEKGRFDQLYGQIVQGERETKELLIHSEQDYPGVTTDSNIDAIAGTLQKKSDKASILAQLRQTKSEMDEAAIKSKTRKRNDHER